MDSPKDTVDNVREKHEGEASEEAEGPTELGEEGWKWVDLHLGFKVNLFFFYDLRLDSHLLSVEGDDDAVPRARREGIPASTILHVAARLRTS